MSARLDRDELNEVDVTRFVGFDILSDDALLDIFDFYSMDSDITFYEFYNKKVVETWQTLVHVCQRWRRLIFRSPSRLNLRLVCTPETRTRDPGTLDVWPALPLIVYGGMMAKRPIISGVDNLVAALEQSNRVCEVDLILVSWKLETVLAVMQVPFPELAEIGLRLDTNSLTLTPPPISNSFLGGSAPRLQYINLTGIPFPGLPILLSSATRLVKLVLSRIPHTGYIPPEVMVASLSTLSSLETLHLHFETPRSHSDRGIRRPPPSKRSVLPALDKFSFEGDTEYLEDFVNRIDTPQLGRLTIEFFIQTNFYRPRLAQFINRTPKHAKCNQARLQFNDWSGGVLLGILEMSIKRPEPDRQLSFAAHVCSSFIPSMIEDLIIERRLPHLNWKDDAIENNSWLKLFRPFTAVKNLYLYQEFAPSIAKALQELVGDKTTEVLPSLQNIFVEELESFQKDIAQFVVARQLSGHPVAVSE